MKRNCPICGKLVGAHVPRGGDGSAVRIGKHKSQSSTLSRAQVAAVFDVPVRMLGSPRDCPASGMVIDR